MTRDCWRWESAYQCRVPERADTCQPLRDKGCEQIGSVCLSRDGDNPTGSCVTYEQHYRCVATPASERSQTVCAPAAFCRDDGTCFDTSHPPDGDFGNAVALMEMSRQAGVYGVDAKNVEIFKGYSERCSVKGVGGTTLKNCCASAGGGTAFTNAAVLGAGKSLVSETGKSIGRTGSTYVYDSLYHKVDSDILKRGLASINSWGKGLGSGSFAPAFSFYGFSFQFTMANGFQFMAFDPYSFALQIAVMLVQKWLACDAEEQTTAMKRGQSLCVHIDTVCRLKVLSVCVEREQRLCCFNSKLAKIVNRGGREQLGLSSKSCGGFTQTQFEKIDFSTIDMTEFIRDVTPKQIDTDAIQRRMSDTVTDKVKHYYDQGKGAPKP